MSAKLELVHEALCLTSCSDKAEWYQYHLGRGRLKVSWCYDANAGSPCYLVCKAGRFNTSLSWLHDLLQLLWHQPTIHEHRIKTKGTMLMLRVNRVVSERRAEGWYVSQSLT